MYTQSQHIFTNTGGYQNSKCENCGRSFRYKLSPTNQQKDCLTDPPSADFTIPAKYH